MADREYRIKILTVADNSGAQAAGEALGATGKKTEELGQAQEQASQSAEKHTLSLKAVHKISHALNELIPGLGYAMQAIWSPVGASVAIAVTALKYFHEKIKEVNQELDKLSEEAAKPANSRLQAMRDASVSAAVGMDALKDRLEQAAKAETSFKDETEKSIAATKDQIAQAQALSDATKDNELGVLEAMHSAGLLSEEQYADDRIKIEMEFQRKKRELQEREEKTEILIKKRALEQAQLNQGGLSDAASSAELKRQFALENVAKFNGDKASTEESLQKDRAALSAWQQKNGKLGDVLVSLPKDDSNQQLHEKLFAALGSSAFTATDFDKKIEEFVRLRGNLDRSQTAFDKLPHQEATRKTEAEAAGREADRAAKRAEENAAFISTTDRDLSMMGDRFNEHHKTNTEISAMELDRVRFKSPGGQTAMQSILQAQDTANKIAHHQYVGVDEQRQLVDTASRGAGHVVPIGEAVALMSRATANVEAFAEMVLRIAARQEKMGKRLEQIQGQIKTKDLNAGG